MPEQISNFIQNALPIIGILSVIIFAIILLSRVIVKILLYFAVKNYKAIRNAARRRKKPKAKKILPKEDDERFVQKDEFAPTKQDSYEIIPSNQEEVAFEKPEIVDIVKPVGFWTSMVLGQKLTYLVSSAKLMNDNSKKGFWTSMVEAEARAAGRQRGKGRS